MFRDLLGRIAESLGARDIPYMVIGGQAVLLYGEPRLTADIDVTLGAGIRRLPDVLRSAQDLALECLPADPEAFVSRTMVLPTRHRESGIRVDFIFSFTPYEAGAIERARLVELDGRKVAFASPEDLVIHKIFAGRPRDMEDVHSVLVRNRSLDLEYIRRWLGEFDSSGEGGGYGKAFEDLLEEADGPGGEDR